ncbi:hypothetical protein, partial [Salmonella sp. s54412]|uniref:hypothetical protein n=1 Tax=Salmonella sp. s54412 TaxID=3160128 RepID=UPI0037551B30
MTTISLVKKRMAEMRDGIDDAEGRTKESEQLKRESVARGYASESEATSLKNRVFQLKSEIDKMNKRVA